MSKTNLKRPEKILGKCCSRWTPMEYTYSGYACQRNQWELTVFWWASKWKNLIFIGAYLVSFIGKKIFIGKSIFLQFHSLQASKCLGCLEWVFEWFWKDSYHFVVLRMFAVCYRNFWNVHRKSKNWRFRLFYFQKAWKCLGWERWLSLVWLVHKILVRRKIPFFGKLQRQNRQNGFNPAFLKTACSLERFFQMVRKNKINPVSNKFCQKFFVRRECIVQGFKCGSVYYSTNKLSKSCDFHLKIFFFCLALLLFSVIQAAFFTMKQKHMLL